MKALTALILTGLIGLFTACTAHARPTLPGLGAQRAMSAPAAGQGCRIQTLQGNPHDAVAQLLQSAPSCPTDVFGFRRLLEQRGARIQTTMVGNRGFHNSGEGSFSLFETVTGPIQTVDFALAPGNLFFGHFIGGDGKQLVSLQAPEQGSLMIELIAFDPAKKLYNFYELIGDGKQGNWFYRGDSLDIRADIAPLHRQSDPAHPAFGRHLRCAGCHLGGGPIMKELALPHNDWWSAKRPLPLGGRVPEPRLAELMNSLQDAELLANHVKAGLAQLQAASPYARSEDLQARLRPLFCPQEVNFASDSQPLDDAAATVGLPSAVLVDPRLMPDDALKMPKAVYLQALQSVGSRFPEIARADADHAWLAPVKSWADRQEVEGLLREGLIDQELVSDVLAIDFSRPVVSGQRCGLLSLLPKTAGPDWQQQFKLHLAQSPLPAAKQLLRHLQQPDAAAHQARAQSLLASCRQRLQTPAGARELLTWVGLQRQAVASSEISANPLGRILEPGFRVIFPAIQLPLRPMQLDAGCRLIPVV